MLKKIIRKLSNKVVIKKGEPGSEEFIELEPEERKKSAKIMFKYYTLTEFADIKPIIDDLREGYTIALVNIKPLKDKDIAELKRAVNKIKKTCQAIDGSLVGISEDYIVGVPNFVEVNKGEKPSEEE